MEGKYNSDNIFFKVLTMLYQVMVLNAMFIVTSIPIITIGASSKAIFRCTRMMIKGELGQEFKTYFSYFKEDFIKVTLTTILLLAGYAAVIVNFIYARNIQGIGWLLTLIQLPVLLQLLLIHSHVFIIHDLFQLPLFKAIKVAWVMGNRNIVKVVGSLGIMYALVKLGLHMPIILVFFIFSFANLIQYFFYYESVKALAEKEEV